MNDALVIVESPAKAKTINRYLGDNYKVMASNGHVRDLLPKSGAVEPENDFVMHYEIIEKNNLTVKGPIGEVNIKIPSRHIDYLAKSV